MKNACFANVGLKIKQIFKTFHFPSHHVFLLMIYFGCWLLMAKRTCIKDGFHDVHALFHIVVHSVHARCLIKCHLGIFSLVWTLMSTKLWGFSCFLIRNMFGPLVVYFTHVALQVHFPCFGHALYIATSYTYLCYICHALVYTSLPHPSISCLPHALWHFFFFFVFYLSFIFSFMLYLLCIIILIHTFISCPLFSLTLCLFMSKRETVYSKVVYRRVLSFLYDSCAHS